MLGRFVRAPAAAVTPGEAPSRVTCMDPLLKHGRIPLLSASACRPCELTSQPNHHPQYFDDKADILEQVRFGRFSTHDHLKRKLANLQTCNFHRQCVA